MYVCAYICICTLYSLDLAWFITYSFHVKGLTEGLIRKDPVEVHVSFKLTIQKVIHSGFQPCFKQLQ